MNNSRVIHEMAKKLTEITHTPRASELISISTATASPAIST